MKAKPVAALLITLALVALAAPILPVMGQIGAQIEQVFPSSAEGIVGTAVGLVGSIDTTNGQFKVFFGSTLVVMATAQGNAISTGFYVPETPGGTHTITLQDVTANSNATHDFTVDVNYAVQASLPSVPALLQEGSTVPLNVSITGGQASTAYVANITVSLPAPLSTNYTRLVTLPTSNSMGSTTTQINFPDSTFAPSGALTDYAGNYQVYFNGSLGGSQFTVGFTDLSQYHRGQTAKINAIGYQPNDTATVTVKSVDSGANLYSADVTPTSAGVVAAQWAVPSNAAIGKYTIAITARYTVKAVPDAQNVTVPGYPLTITVTDLASRPVPEIVVEALDTVTNKTYGATSAGGGNASISLEAGKVTLTAFWNDLQVGETNINVNGEGTFALHCELGDLRIAVKDRNGLLIPSVNLEITYSYLTTKGQQSKSGSTTGQTDVSGVFSLNSTPPSISYSINASIYGVVFNEGNKTVSNLPVQAVSEVTILCPSRTLTFNIVDYYGNPIPDARLSMLEITAGIFYGENTNTEGSATVQATFGRYTARIYKGSVLLNQTQIDAFTDKQVGIQCVLYNLQVNVKVVDYFGQAIPNANVKLVGADGRAQSEIAQSDGTAVFNGVIGGNVQITAYLSQSDDYYESANVYVGSPTTVQVQMGRYVALGGIVAQTSLFITLLIILPTIVAFIVFELYMRRRGKPKKPAANVEKAVSK